MECFNGFWSRRVEEERTSPSWVVDQSTLISDLISSENYRKNKTYNWYLQYIVRRQSTGSNNSEEETSNSDCHYCISINNVNCNGDSTSSEIMAENDFEMIKRAIKTKASKHREFYKNLLNNHTNKRLEIENENNIDNSDNDNNNDDDDDDNDGDKNTSKSVTITCSECTSAEQVEQPAIEIRPSPTITSEQRDKFNINRQRRIGVFQMEENTLRSDYVTEEQTFPSVDKFITQYTNLIQQQMERITTTVNNQKTTSDQLTAPSSLPSPTVPSSSLSPSLSSPSPSPSLSPSLSPLNIQYYNSDDEENRNWLWTNSKKLNNDKRCFSSDSALELMQSEDEELLVEDTLLEENDNNLNESSNINNNSNNNNNDNDNDNINIDRNTSNLINEINNPYYYAITRNRGSIDHCNVPSKTLVEAHYVPLPLDRPILSDCDSVDDSDGKFGSRRQSCFTDDGEEQPRYRYWRTPSVVVSDYSDDVIAGLTLEDIEYFRNQRKDISSSPDSSLNSSCSNLNYCGSSVSVLDADYTLRTPTRKISDCSTCSTISGDEDAVYNHLQPLTSTVYGNKPSGWRKLRNIVQWTPFFQTYKKQRYPWVQLAGHQGNFKAGPDQGTILKKLCPKEEKCFKVLMKDVLRPYVPEYKGQITSDDGECTYLQLQDLLGDFSSPCVMDCKIGVRTYLEEELAKAKENPKLRKDMYEKMIQIDPGAPTEEEHRLKGITKPRYMVWRETISSTACLGFRIEGIKKADGTSSKDFKTTKTKEQIIEAFKDFTNNFPHAIPKYIQRLKAIKATLDTSEFFQTHEVIGSSLLFVHDRCNANIWLIDFAKSLRLPDDTVIDHNSKWTIGSHEDGYLIGINNLISIFVTMLEQQPVVITPPPPDMIQTNQKSEDEKTNY